MASIDPASLKVVELRTELSSRSLPTKGKKDELIARLTEALAKEEEEQAVEKPSEEIIETPQEEAVEKPAEEVVEKLEEEEEEVVEKPVEEDIKKPKEKMTEKPAEEIVEKPAEEVLAKPDKEEKPQVVVIEKPKEDIIEKPKEEVIEKPKEEVVQKPKEEEIQKPKQEIAQKPKESMDTDRLKRRRSDDVAEAQEEKRPRVEAEKDQVKENKVESSALYVKGFIRPLIIRSVQELFNSYGKVKRFWMDSIKTHCYVTYETDADAKKAFDNIHGVVFPKDTGKTLTVGGLTPEQVEKLIEHEQAAAERRLRVDWEPLIQKVKNGESLPPSPGSDNFRKPRSVGMDQIARQLAQAAEPAPSTSRHVNVEPPRERRELSLEDLFRKTKAIPPLYYLPNTDEQAKLKLKELQNL